LLPKTAQATAERLYRGFDDATTVASDHTVFRTLDYREGQLASRIRALHGSPRTAGIAILLDNNRDLKDSAWLGEIEEAFQQAADSFPVVILKLGDAPVTGSVRLGDRLIPYYEEADANDLGYRGNLAIMEDWGARKILMQPESEITDAQRAYVSHFNDKLRSHVLVER
jgi:hypothetical protein